MEEQWETVVYDGEVFDKYEVSNTGKVRNKKTGRILKPCDNDIGYLFVGLYKDGKRKYIYIHRSVAYVFIPNYDETKTEVNHIDHNRYNNHVENLEWCNRQFNIEYSHAKRVLCVETGVIYPSVRQAERETGLTQSGIWKCCTGKGKTCGGYHWEYVD